MNLLFVNNNQPQCGVYQYGLRLGKILQKSKNINVTYVKVSNNDEFSKINLDNFQIIIFNYIESGSDGPYYWVNNQLFDSIKQKNPNIKISTILHTFIPNHINFDFIIDQDPNGINGIPRPLFDYDLIDTEKNQRPTIGSFGFQGARKGFEQIVNVTNDQFDDAVINLNITNNYFGDRDSYLTNNQINNIRSISLKPNVNLNLSSNFLSNKDTVNFLRKNDINMFLYRNSNDISSVIDYAIYANRPIAITNERCFRHIYNENIDIDKRSITSIIDFCNNENYIQKLKDSWSEINLLDKFEKIVYNI